jgi:hypothetical protein
VTVCLLALLCLCVNFWLKNNLNVIPHPLYSPDLCDFLLFPKVEMVLKRRRFNDVTMIQAKSWDTFAKF